MTVATIVCLLFIVLSSSNYGRHKVQTSVENPMMNIDVVNVAEGAGGMCL